MASSSLPSQANPHSQASQPHPPSQNPSSIRARSRSIATKAAAHAAAVAKASWDDGRTEIFIRICVTETTNGNRPGPHFNKLGWQNLVARFNQLTGLSYSRKMLKNKWDVLRKDWGIWQKLVRNETGLGWDPVRGTVDASAEWWTRKLQVTPDAAKFRARGPLMVDEQETLFSDCVANGGGAWTPNSGVMPQHMVEEDVPHPMDTLDEEEEEEEEGYDGEADGMGDDASTYGGPSGPPTTAVPSPVVPRKSRNFPPRSKLGKYKKPSTAQIVAKCLQTLVSKFDNITPPACPCNNQSFDSDIDTCLSILDNLEGVDEGDDLWMYATRLFLKPVVRELFVKMKTDRVRVLWLKNQLQRDITKHGMSSTSHCTSSKGLSCNNQNYSS